MSKFVPGDVRPALPPHHNDAPARGGSIPRVTVITPTYNRSALLAETIDSVLAQGYRNLEYIIVDDGSTDGTQAVIERYRARHPTTIVHLAHANRGEAASVNRAWQIATGDYVGIVSSDDPQPAAWLSVCVAHMESHPHIVVGYPDWFLLNEAGEPLGPMRVPDYSFHTMLVETNCLPGPGALIRRSACRATELRNTSFRYASDYETWLRLGLDGDFMRIPATVAAWRQHAGSLTVSSDLARATEYRRAVDSLFAQPNLPATIRGWKRRARSHAAFVAARILVERSWLRAATLVAFAITTSPRAISRKRALAMLVTERLPGPRALAQRIIPSRLRMRLKPYVMRYERSRRRAGKA